MSKKILYIEDIKKLIPHRYPMLLVDRIIDYEPGEYGVGLKNVSGNEPFFNGHFPGKPIMPGVMMVEALAQTGGVITALGVHSLADKVIFFMSLNNVKFRAQVVPGDVLRLEVRKTKIKGRIWCYHGEADVDGKLAVEADFMAMIADKN